MLIDSSVFVKFFSKEPGWEKVVEYVEDGITLGLAVAELASAFSKKTSDGEIAVETARGLLGDFARKGDFLDEKKYVDIAFKYAAEGPIKAYDALFVAAAVKEGLALASCDKRQCDFAKSVGVDVIRC